MSALGIAEFRQASVAIVLPLLLIFAGCGASGSDEALSPTATPEGQATAPSDAWTSRRGDQPSKSRLRR